MRKLFLLLMVSLSLASFAQSHEALIASLEKSLSGDQDFQMNAAIDRKLLDLQRDTSAGTVLPPDDHYIALIQSTAKAETEEALIKTWTGFGIKRPDMIAGLLREKIASLEKVAKKFPELGKLTKAELNQVLSYCFHQLASGSAHSASLQHQRGCNNACCDSYVDAIDDCDTDFALGTAGAIVSGILGGLFGSPLVGGAIITTGIGAAWAYNARCSATAARAYRRCMGYE